MRGVLHRLYLCTTYQQGVPAPRQITQDGRAAIFTSSLLHKGSLASVRHALYIRRLPDSESEAIEL